MPLTIKMKKKIKPAYALLYQKHLIYITNMPPHEVLESTKPQELAIVGTAVRRSGRLTRYTRQARVIGWQH